jgi:hypothetical protein
MTFLAVDSSNAADRLLRDHPPAASLRIKAMGADEARLLLAYPVMQQTRWWLMEGANVELLLGAVFFLVLLFATGEGKTVLAFTLGMYAIVLFQRFFILPQVLYLGSLMDFVPANVVIPERNQLTVAQTGFIGLEIFKILMGFGLAAYLITRSHRSNHFRDDLA